MIWAGTLLGALTTGAAMADESMKAVGSEARQTRAESGESGQERSEQARAHFDAGRALVAEGRIAEGCDELEASRALVRGIGTDYNLADCWERMGRLADAHELFLGVAEAAAQSGQAEREEVARGRARALGSKLPRLVVEVAAPLPDLRITRDGTELARSSWGTSVLVDAGPHRIAASAPEHLDWFVELIVPDGMVTVAVTVPELAPSSLQHATWPARRAVEPPAPAPMLQVERPAEQHRRRGLVPGVVLGVVGAAGTAVGSAFLARYLSRNEDAKEICPVGRGCRPEEIDEHGQLVDEARAARNLAWIGYGVGGASLVGLAAVFAAGLPRNRDSRATRRMGLTLVLDDPFGARLGWTF